VINWPLSAVLVQKEKVTGPPFPSLTTWRASNPLELVHTDLCGPFSTESQAGNKYFITFIDDFSRYCWVYFLRQKNQAFSCFKQFKSLVEANSVERLKCLRSDRGGEYMSNEFKAFCEEHGIRHQLTVPYTPQQNGNG
jgi:transposase InsO family protein